MNKNFLKLTGCLAIAVLFLLALLVIVFAGFTAVWLHTYRVFTKEKLVAEITVSELRKENGREYFDLRYKPVEDRSALTFIFDRSGTAQNEFEPTEEYRLYGDHFEAGGQVVKFDNWGTILGFETIYKVARIEGDYTDVNKARNNPERSVFELNGGVDQGWKYLENNESRLGFFVDSVFGSYVTRFVQKEEKTYGLYITEDGFIIEELKSIND